MTGTSDVTMTTETPGTMNGMLNLCSLHVSLQKKHILTAYFIYCISRLVNVHINVTKIINCTNYCSSTDTTTSDIATIVGSTIGAFIGLVIITITIIFALYVIAYQRTFICTNKGKQDDNAKKDDNN